MNILFGILYLLFGAAWTFLAITPGNFGSVAAVMAAVNFFACWGKFFGGGIALRIVHVSLGSLIVLIWVAAMIDLSLHLTGYLHWVDTGGMMGYLEVFIGGILVIPVIAYIVNFTGWLGQRRRQARADTASIAPGAPSESTVATDRPGMPTGNSRGSTPQRFHVAVGSVTLLLWVSCWYFLVLNYFAFVKSLGPISRGVVEIVAYILTIPAILYVVALCPIALASCGRRPLRDATKEVAESRGHAASGRRSLSAPRCIARIRRVGLVLLVLLIAGVAFRALLGDDIMCHGGNASACLTVAAKDVKLKLWNESPCHFADAWSYDEIRANLP